MKLVIKKTITTLNQKKQQGFSLVETIVTIFVFSLAIVALTNLILSNYRVYSYNFQDAQAIEEGRRAVEVMMREIREAKYGDDGSYPLALAGDYTFIFFSDIDGDGVTERVRYFLDGTVLKEGVIKPTGDPPQYILANEIVTNIFNYVRNGDTIPIFVYYNGDWPADTVNNPLPTLTRLSDTKLMHVHLVINVDPNRSPQNFHLESDTQIRNLKTNL